MEKRSANNASNLLNIGDEFTTSDWLGDVCKKSIFKKIFKISILIPRVGTLRIIKKNN